MALRGETEKHIALYKNTHCYVEFGPGPGCISICSVNRLPGLCCSLSFTSGSSLLARRNVIVGAAFAVTMLRELDKRERKNMAKNISFKRGSAAGVQGQINRPSPERD